jgi:hypothetical protein
LVSPSSLKGGSLMRFLNFGWWVPGMWTVQ